VIGLDTNVLLRLFDKTDAAQTARAESAVRAQQIGGCYLNAIVLSELVWVLARAYKYTRVQISERIELVFEAPEFTIQYADEAARALACYQKGPAGFTDYFVAEINRFAGCSKTLTFDAKARKAVELFVAPPTPPSPTP
jgi:predicted nucleic-acid-binding protein